MAAKRVTDNRVSTAYVYCICMCIKRYTHSSFATRPLHDVKRDGHLSELKDVARNLAARQDAVTERHDDQDTHRSRDRVVKRVDSVRFSEHRAEYDAQRRDHCEQGHVQEGHAPTVRVAVAPHESQTHAERHEKLHEKGQPKLVPQAIVGLLQSQVQALDQLSVRERRDGQEGLQWPRSRFEVPEPPVHDYRGHDEARQQRADDQRDDGHDLGYQHVGGCSDRND